MNECTVYFLCFSVHLFSRQVYTRSINRCLMSALYISSVHHRNAQEDRIYRGELFKS